MSNNQFIRLTAAKTTRGTYEVIINHHFINFAVASNSNQVGKSIVTLAHERDNRNTVAAMYDIETLATKISHLTPVQVYNPSTREVTGSGLVNLARVIQIMEYETFVNLTFVDGDQINVTNRFV